VTRHYAENGCQTDPAACQSLMNCYIPDTAQDILAYLRMITFDNLFGDTFDALLSHIVGKPAAGSSFFGELGVILGGLIVVPFGMIFRLLTRPAPRPGRAE
jgi:hypothetical protein